MAVLYCGRDYLLLALYLQCQPYCYKNLDYKNKRDSQPEPVVPCLVPKEEQGGIYSHGASKDSKTKYSFF